MIITGNKGLPKLRAKALIAIDSAADCARQAFIGAGAGQAIVYAAKAAEAAAFLAGAPGEYPFLTAEVGITGASIRDVAAAIAQKAAAWNAAAPKIEALRLQAKKFAAAARTPDAVAAVQNISWPSP